MMANELLAALKVASDALDFAQAQVDSPNDARHLRSQLAKVQRVIAKAESDEQDGTGDTREPFAWAIECSEGLSFTNVRDVAVRWPQSKTFALYR